MGSKQGEHNAFLRWKHTKIGRLVWAILAGAIAYVFASIAIDSGSLWQWGLAILFAGDSIYNLVQLVRKFVERDSQSDKA